MHEMWKKTKGKRTGGQIMGGTKRETERLRKYGCIFNIHGRISKIESFTSALLMVSRQEIPV